MGRVKDGFDMGLRQLMYHHLVTNNENIKNEYEGNNLLYPEQHRKHRIKSWIWLVGLNIKYKILKISPTRIEENGQIEKVVKEKIKEKIIINPLESYKYQGGVPFLYDWKGKAYVGSETECAKIVQKTKYNLRPPLCRIMYQFRDIELASFDIFDTLLLRPFSNPKDLFYMVGKELNEPYFYALRTRCEKEARDIKEKEEGTREIDIYDIYDRISYYTGIDPQIGVKTEYEIELKLLYVNKYMKYIMDTFANNGVPVILISDMYYPKDMMENLLKNKEISNYQNLYVSCDFKCSKNDGGLFEAAYEPYDNIEKDKIQHFDDNYTAVKKAREIGIKAFHYAQCNGLCVKYRPIYLSPLIGSAYKGVVANYLYCDEARYSVPYEYGFIYGGLLALGYCEYLYREIKKKGIKKILFVSRDGDVIKQAWDYVHSDIPSDYVLVSRRCIAMLASELWKKMFLESVVDRCSAKREGMKVGEILDYFGIGELRGLLDASGINEEWKISMKEDPDKVNLFRDFIEANIVKCVEIYRESNQLYEEYISKIIDGIDGNVAIVDVGWRGTAGMMLERVIEKINPGIKAFTFLCGNRQPGNIVEIRDNTVNCYLFSSEKNYDALFRHGESTNFCYELLFTSATPPFGYFYKDGDGKAHAMMGNDEIANHRKILEIQRGIMDFVKEYTCRFKDYHDMYSIPESDVTQVLYNIMSQRDYFKTYFGDILYSPEIGESRDTLKNWM